ncbi:hypothetical protein T492DRAFT_921235 [Pavlovales sp. CCMP2436]|nr:hypothetical protein T492DRAFT_921235 [Pavlovales sp. CCMP2436]
MWAADASSPSSPSPFAVSAHTQGEVVFEAGQATAAIFLELHKQAADAFKQGAAETERRPSLSPPLPHSSAARSEQLEMLQPLHKAAQEEEGEEREEMVSSVSLASEQGEEGGEGSKVYFRLVSVRVHGSITQQAHVSVGAPEKATLVLLPLSAAQQPQRGTVGWAETAVVCVESVGAVSLLLERTGGLDGTLSLSYRTRDGTAIVGADYKQAQGTVTFLPGVSSMSVHVHIVDDEAFEETEHFFVDLSCEEEGVLSGESVCTVSILDDDSWREKMSRVRSRVRKQLALSLNLNGTGSWAHKFTDALVLSGGIDDETGEELPPSAFDSLMHSVTLFWKLFGCVIGLGDAITAITFVAVGTSLPDTFASRLAILNDEFADAAVGNVTGSNAVNVFLGLGIPWLIASIYHAYSPHGAGKYLVPASGLSFSVVLFTSFAVVAISLLFTRRFTLGGEIGGNARTARLTAAFLFTMWLVYIVLVSLNVNGIVTALS